MGELKNPFEFIKNGGGPDFDLLILKAKIDELIRTLDRLIEVKERSDKNVMQSNIKQRV